MEHNISTLRTLVGNIQNNTYFDDVQFAAEKILSSEESESSLSKAHYENDIFQLILEYMNVYLTPLIAIIGILGNLICFSIYSFSYLKYKSSSVYLAAQSLSGVGYLVCVLCIWTARIGVVIFHKEYLCQTINYLMYIFSNVTTMCLMWLTVETYINM